MRLASHLVRAPNSRSGGHDSADKLPLFLLSPFMYSTLHMKGQWESNINIWCIPRNETVQPRYFQNRIIMLCLPVSPLIYLWEIYVFPGSVCLLCCSQYVERSWEYINRTQTHECRNWDWGRGIPFLGIHKFDFPYSVVCVCTSVNCMYRRVH